MEEKRTSIFREANLKKAAEPEKLDGYLKVAGFGPWFVVLAAGLILAAFFIWMFFGRLQTSVTGAGYCSDGKLVCYVTQDEFEEISSKTAVDIEGLEGTITGTDDRLYAASEIPNDILYLLPDSRWYCIVEVACDGEDGLYTAVFLNEVEPASFMSRED